MIKFFSWYGGKIRMVNYIKPLIPMDVTAFYEPFMGSGAVTLNKWRDGVEVLNDVDTDITRLFSLMADKEKGKVLIERLLKLEYSQEQFEIAKKATKNKFLNISDEFRKAELTFILITQSFNSTRKNYRRGVSQETYSNDLYFHLPKVYERLQGVIIKNMDGIDLIQDIKDNESTFVFCDPPYRKELRGAKDVYKCELSSENQVRLLKTIVNSKCKIMLCGYRSGNGSDLYDEYLLPYGWKHYRIAELVKSCQNKKTKDIAEEWIWVNYELPTSAKYFIDLSTSQR